MRARCTHRRCAGRCNAVVPACCARHLAVCTCSCLHILLPAPSPSYPAMLCRLLPLIAIIVVVLVLPVLQVLLLCSGDAELPSRGDRTGRVYVRMAQTRATSSISNPLIPQAAHSARSSFRTQLIPQAAHSARNSFRSRIPHSSIIRSEPRARGFEPLLPVPFVGPWPMRAAQSVLTSCHPDCSQSPRSPRSPDRA